MADVVSFNRYAKGINRSDWIGKNDLGKPLIIGEFHFGALDRGMFHAGLGPTGSQQERAESFKRYVRSVEDCPAFVGCHWFEYIDEPNTGRCLDGENYNIGFVDVTDTPYPEMVEAAKEIGAEVYRGGPGSRASRSTGRLHLKRYGAFRLPAGMCGTVDADFRVEGEAHPFQHLYSMTIVVRILDF